MFKALLKRSESITELTQIFNNSYKISNKNVDKKVKRLINRGFIETDGPRLRGNKQPYKISALGWFFLVYQEWPSFENMAFHDEFLFTELLAEVFTAKTISRIDENSHLHNFVFIFLHDAAKESVRRIEHIYAMKTDKDFRELFTHEYIDSRVSGEISTYLQAASQDLVDHLLKVAQFESEEPRRIRAASRNNLRIGLKAPLSDILSSDTLFKNWAAEEVEAVSGGYSTIYGKAAEGH